MMSGWEFGLYVALYLSIPALGVLALVVFITWAMERER